MTIQTEHDRSPVRGVGAEADVRPVGWYWVRYIDINGTWTDWTPAYWSGRTCRSVFFGGLREGSDAIEPGKPCVYAA